jgi:hypothetical protein
MRIARDNFGTPRRSLGQFRSNMESVRDRLQMPTKHQFILRPVLLENRGVARMNLLVKRGK